MFKPVASEYDQRLSGYILESPDKNLLELFSSTDTGDYYKRIPSSKYDYRYNPGKWSIKEILNHIIDGERIFSFRALWIARGCEIELPGYDENLFSRHSDADSRPFEKLIEEYSSVRVSTRLLFQSFNEQMLKRTGVFDNKFASVKSLGYLIIGHELHHIRVINEKYL